MFNIYLATMKGDPKIVQMAHHPSISLLISPRSYWTWSTVRLPITVISVFAPWELMDILENHWESQKEFYDVTKKDMGPA